MGDEPRQRGVDALCDVLGDEQTLDERELGRRVRGTDLTQRDRPHCRYARELARFCEAGSRRRVDLICDLSVLFSESSCSYDGPSGRPSDNAGRATGNDNATASEYFR